ncbi:NAD(+) diphosphatase [Enterovirga rhinocerotis]|uniref:NAD(+) diphosphatase n=1 Tax=Enterovirga rhinocerotis TaxID=1339210 RepID=A0A4R7BPE0_9HYPH|nr:NAD(+) diphosphatase [Enterovirga rhinocerotis]TDR87231.1 NAD+ diphosphatase [Enterovirga rhinocerotis]
MTRPLELGFAANLIDRSGAEREAESYLAVVDSPNTLHVVIAGESAILLDPGDGGPTAFVPTEALAGETVIERTFLGRLDGRPILGALLEAARGQELKDDPGFFVSDLRSIAIDRPLPAGEIGLLAQAKSLLHWHLRHRHCANCGAQTAPAQAGQRRDCATCGAQHFPRTDPVTIMLIARGDHCLLGRQARFVQGSYSCLAGFVSPGETIEAAVRREVMEEAGIRVGTVRYMFSQPWPFPSSLMIGCMGEALDETLTVDLEELEDARWFPREEVAAMLERRHEGGLITPPPMAIAHHLIRAWVDGATPTG